MKEEKEQRELSEERLLTENEKKYIIGAIEKRDIKLGIAIYGIMLFFLTLLCLIFISLDGVKSAISIFLVVNIGVLLMLRNSWNTASKLADAVKKNEIYVKEAIYESSNKYHYATFEVRKSGRRDWICSSAFFAERINKGEKVILIQKDEVVVWVYKAREDNEQPISNF